MLGNLDEMPGGNLQSHSWGVETSKSLLVREQYMEYKLNARKVFK